MRSKKTKKVAPIQARLKQIVRRDRGLLQWRVNTGQLFKEIIDFNSQMACMRAPITIFRSILIEIGQRAIELNDPELNSLMVRLAIYGEGDPFDKDFKGWDFVNDIIRKGVEAKSKRLANGNKIK